MYLWNSKYLRSTADTSVTECDKIITVMDIVSTRRKNTIAANVTSMSISCHSKNVRYCYILHTVLLVNILLLIIIIIYCYYVKQKGAI